MKRVLLSTLIVGLFAGPALAGMYVPTIPTLMSFTWQGASDAALSYPGRGSLDQVLLLPGGKEVGFAGDMGDSADDLGNTATVTIGTTGLGVIGYDGFRTRLRNYDDDPWSVQLYSVQGGVSSNSGAFVYLAPGSEAWLSVSGSGTITAIGFTIEGSFDGGSPSNPDVYHIAAVPIPGAAILGFLGLMAAGVKLRKFV